MQDGFDGLRGVADAKTMVGKKQIMMGLQLLISCTVIIVLCNLVDFSRFRPPFVALNFPIVFALVASLAVAQLVRIVRWRMLMNSRQGVRILLSDAFRIHMAGNALNLFLPAGGGDVAKSFFGYRWSGVKERMFAVSLLDKLVAVAGVAPLAIMASLMTRQWWYVFPGLFCLAPLVVYWLIMRMGVSEWQKRILVTLRVPKLDAEMVFGPKEILLGVLISIFGWFVSYLLLYFSLIATTIDLSLGDAFAFGPILTIVRLFPFSANGLGTDEAAFAYLFKGFGSIEDLLVAALFYRVVHLGIPGLLGGLVIAVTRKIEFVEKEPGRSASDYESS